MTSWQMRSCSGVKSQVRINFFFDYSISGTVKDYYIVVAYDYNEMTEGFPAKKFYWCSSSNYIFSQLPSILPNMRDKFNLMVTYLSGEYDRILIEGVGKGTVIDEDQGIVLPPKPVTELDRLSHIVNEIDHQCSVVPKGSYKFTPLKEVRKNEAFRGLSKEESDDSAFTIANW